MPEFVADSLLEEAVSSEPVSEDTPKFPVIQGKYREFHPGAGRIGNRQRGIACQTSDLGNEFPGGKNREFFRSNRETDPLDQGIRP